MAATYQPYTARRVAILRAVLDFTAEHGYSSSGLELAGMLGTSRATADAVLRRLTDEGLVKRGHRGRTRTVTQAGMKALEEQL